MKTKQENRTSQETLHVDLSAHDKYGRAIGAIVSTYEVDFVEAPDATVWETYEPGHYFSFYPHATRNKQPYGASQSDRHFTTATARTRAIETYINGARKRAQR